MIQQSTGQGSAWVLGVPGIFDVIAPTVWLSSSAVISPLYQRGSWSARTTEIQLVCSAVVALMAALTALVTAFAAASSPLRTSSPNSTWLDVASSKARLSRSALFLSSANALTEFCTLTMVVRRLSRRMISRAAASRLRSFRRLKCSVMSVVPETASAPMTTPISPSHALIHEASMGRTLAEVLS